MIWFTSTRHTPREQILCFLTAGQTWEFKDPQYPDYPTEKNLDMLKSIVKTSSNPDSIVLDCFCGSGTTLLAAQLLDRQWIGIDQSETAIATSAKRLNENSTGFFATTSSYEQIDLYEKLKIKMAV